MKDFVKVKEDYIPKEGSLIQESANDIKVKDAKVDTEIAELRAKAAEAKAREAEAVAKTAEYRHKVENQDAIIAEAIKEAKERLIDATSRQVEALQAYHEKAQQYEPVVHTAYETIKEQKERIVKLETILGVKKEEEAKLISDTDYYNDHSEQGKRYLAKVARNIAPYQKSLADYLNRQVAKLNKEVGLERGMVIFSACSQSLVKAAAWFQENSDTIKEYDASSISDYLCRADDYLLTLLRMRGARKTKEEREANIENEYQYKTENQEEEPMTHGGQNSLLNRLLDKLG